MVAGFIVIDRDSIVIFLLLQIVTIFHNNWAINPFCIKIKFNKLTNLYSDPPPLKSRVFENVITFNFVYRLFRVHSYRVSGSLRIWHVTLQNAHVCLITNKSHLLKGSWSITQLILELLHYSKHLFCPFISSYSICFCMWIIKSIYAIV